MQPSVLITHIQNSLFTSEACKKKIKKLDKKKSSFDLIEILGDLIILVTSIVLEHWLLILLLLKVPFESIFRFVFFILDSS